MFYIGLEGGFDMVIAGLVAEIPHLSMSSLAMWQTTETVAVGNGHLVEIFIVIAGVALLAQAVVIVALVVGLMKALKTVSAYAAEIKPKVMPIIEKTNDIMGTVKTTAAELAPKISPIVEKTNDIMGTVRTTAAELSPKIVEITGKVGDITSKAGVIAGHATEISAMVKDKVVDFGPTVEKVKETINAANETVLDATHKTQEQVQKLNQVVTESIEATVKAGQSLRHTVTAPGRSIAGAVSGAKAAVTNFFTSKKPAGRPQPIRPAYRAPYRADPAVPIHPEGTRSGGEPIDI